MTPDLDRYMAEKLMGWIPIFTTGRRDISPGCSLAEDYILYWKDPKNQYIVCHDWHPTKSIDQAFMCMEKVKEWQFSQRYKFIKALEKIIAKDHPELHSGEVITGLWNLFYLKPENIIKAIHAALEDNP